MQATTIRLVEKLMEVQYKSEPMFFEEDGAMTYSFDVYKFNDLEITGALHVYECSMRLTLDYYNTGEGEPFKVQTEDITSFKELTQLLENA